jgi:hypothetical protein
MRKVVRGVSINWDRKCCSVLSGIERYFELWFNPSADQIWFQIPFDPHLVEVSYNCDWDFDALLHRRIQFSKLRTGRV